jgi:hypothetical protein
VANNLGTDIEEQALSALVPFLGDAASALVPLAGRAVADLITSDGGARHTARGMVSAAELDGLEQDLSAALAVRSFHNSARASGAMTRIAADALSEMTFIEQAAMVDDLGRVTLHKLRQLLSAGLINDGVDTQRQLSQRLAAICARGLTERGYEYKGHIEEFVNYLLGLNE